MKILSHTGGVFATNSYLVFDEESGEAALFDAPNSTTQPLLKAAAENRAKLLGLWLTHGHIDHIADHAVVRSHFPDSKLLIHRLDEPKLQNPSSMYALPFHTPAATVDGYLSDDQTLHIGKHEVKVIFTPGHSPGHVAFYIPSQKVLIGGDLILMGAVGRTDFPDCSYADLQASLRRIMQLPGDTHLLPGHGHPSLLSDERQSNPYVEEALRAAG